MKNFRSFVTTLDEYHDKMCTKIHKYSDEPTHTSILYLVFEQFPNSPFGIVLFTICQAGLYLSTAVLNKTNNTLQIDPHNMILLTHKKVYEIQLLVLTDTIGLAVYKLGLPKDRRRIFFQTFQILKTSKSF